jgi:hypothetical protein
VNSGAWMYGAITAAALLALTLAVAWTSADQGLRGRLNVVQIGAAAILVVLLVVGLVR